MNKNVKYKWVTFSSGAGKTFLDKSCFSSEDDLNYFEFSQAYTNLITLIEMVSDPIMAHRWQAHPKHMISDREFLDWVQAWCAHDHL